MTVSISDGVLLQEEDIQRMSKWTREDFKHRGPIELHGTFNDLLVTLKHREEQLEKTRWVYNTDMMKMREQNNKLRNAIIDLLMSADCSWEERNEGHDWALACEKARRLINPIPNNALPG